jgi:hypothetical protein
MFVRVTECHEGDIIIVSTVDVVQAPRDVVSSRVESSGRRSSGAWLAGVRTDLAAALTSRVTFAIPFSVTGSTALEASQTGFIFTVAQHRHSGLVTPPLRFFLTSQPRRSHRSWMVQWRQGSALTLAPPRTLEPLFACLPSNSPLSIQLLLSHQRRQARWLWT